MTAVHVVAAMFAADVLAVNPMMPRHVAGHPNHFRITGPITRAVIVKWPVANLDFEASGPGGSRKKNSRRNKGDDHKFVFNHTLLLRAQPSQHMGLFSHIPEFASRRQPGIRYSVGFNQGDAGGIGFAANDRGVIPGREKRDDD
jgi:hypothetical protein